MSILMYFDVGIITALLISFFVLVFINITMGYIISSMQLKKLDRDCDPQKYLDMLDKVEKRRGKEAKIISRLAINRAAAHIALGNVALAKDYLDGVDKEYISEKDGSLLVYTINRIICLYELGEGEKAEFIYETELVKLCPLGKRLLNAVEILIGERYYYLGEYELCYEHLTKLKKYDLCKRQYLSIIYRLAQIDIIRGDNSLAIKKLTKIIKFGNKLGIVRTSREMLDKLNPDSRQMADT